MSKRAGRHIGCHRHRSRGFTLVEAMVALIVLSIGLLGIAALYIETLRAGRTSLYRTEAVNLATDLADRMRANRIPANAYDCGDPCVASAGGNAIAITDLTAWLAAIGAQLPGGVGNVTLHGRHRYHTERVRHPGELERGRTGQCDQLPGSSGDLR